MDNDRGRDIVAQLPDELAYIQNREGKLPPDVHFEPGAFCIWGDRHFIHTRATLPLMDIDHGVGFGLWVEVTKTDFERYVKADTNDEKYRQFQTDGVLANNWPGFQNILGVKVKVRTIRANDKVYITEVLMDHPRDPLFEVSLLAQKGDEKSKRMIRELVAAYTKDLQTSPDKN